MNGLINNGGLINQTDEAIITPLMVACSKEMRSVASFLIEKGCDCNRKDRDGCLQSNLDLIELLLKSVDMYQVLNKAYDYFLP